MKGEYAEHKNHESSNNMFSKLQPHPFHHHHHHQSFQLQPLHHHQLHPSFPFQISRESQTPPEDEDTSRSSGGLTTAQPASGATPTATQKSGREQPDGASIEVSRRPRGRPPGSKNKPKPAVIVTREPEPVMSPYVLEIPSGSDVVDSLSKFSRRKGIGLCVLSGSGSVANVTLRQPATARGTTMTFHGRFDILSLSATILPQTTSSLQHPHSTLNIAVSISGPQGQIFGGAVAGSLMSAGVVYVVAASFNSPTYNRLTSGDQEEMEQSNTMHTNNNNVSGVVSGNERQSPQDVSGGDGQGVESCGGVVPMYSHLASDVIWAPTAARPPGAPPSY